MCSPHGLFKALFFLEIIIKITPFFKDIVVLRLHATTSQLKNDLLILVCRRKITFFKANLINQFLNTFPSLTIFW